MSSHLPRRGHLSSSNSTLASFKSAVSKPLGEPAGDRRQQVVRFLGPALRPVQAGEPHRRTKFRRSGNLPAGDLARPAEAGGRFGPITDRRRGQELPHGPMDLRPRQTESIDQDTSATSRFLDRSGTFGSLAKVHGPRSLRQALRIWNRQRLDRIRSGPPDLRLGLLAASDGLWSTRLGRQLGEQEVAEGLNVGPLEVARRGD